MIEKIIRWFVPIIGILGLGLSAAVTQAAQSPLSYQQQLFEYRNIQYPVTLLHGYRLELLTDKLDGPRLLTFTEQGELLIGSKSGNVYRLTPPYRQPQVLIKLPDYPHSIAVRKDEIYIAQTHGLYRAAYRAGQQRIDPADIKLLAALPGGGGHNSRSVAVGPDQRLYVSLGITGNCSNQYLGKEYQFDDRRGGILVLNEAVGQWEVYASGLRNPVGFAWQPQTNMLYASNNGPDHHGFEQPPEYFSRVTAGSFHGMPWFQYDGSKLQRDNCIDTLPPRPAAEVALPVATFPSRNAPMGVVFVPPGIPDERLHGSAIVALRGSWGTQPRGGFVGDPATRRPPKLVLVRFDGAKPQGIADLVSGFQLKDGKRWARPVGVALGQDGAVYFTSDSGINGLFRLTAIAAQSDIQ